MKRMANDYIRFCQITALTNELKVANPDNIEKKDNLDNSGQHSNSSGKKLSLLSLKQIRRLLT